MKDYVIIGVIVLIVALATFYTVKHFKGESSCCGGGGYRPKRKKLKNVKYRKTFRVSGMHCINCKRRVEEAVNGIKGVACKADFKKGEIELSYEDDVPDEIIKVKIERAGYTLVS